MCIRDRGWVNYHLGRASAIAWTMFLLLIVIGLVYFLVSKRLQKSH